MSEDYARARVRELVINIEKLETEMAQIRAAGASVASALRTRDQYLCAALEQIATLSWLGVDTTDLLRAVIFTFRQGGAMSCDRAVGMTLSEHANTHYDDGYRKGRADAEAPATAEHDWRWDPMAYHCKRCGMIYAQEGRPESGGCKA